MGDLADYLNQPNPVRSYMGGSCSPTVNRAMWAIMDGQEIIRLVHTKSEAQKICAAPSPYRFCPVSIKELAQ